MASSLIRLATLISHLHDYWLGILQVIVCRHLFRLFFLWASFFSTSAAFAAGDLLFEGIYSTPLSRVVPGETLLLQANVTNSGDAVVEGTVVVSIDEFPKLQSARRVILPAGAKERLDLLVPIPATAKDLKQLHLTATVIIQAGNRSVTLERNGKPVIYKLTLNVGEGQTFAIAPLPDQPKQPEWTRPQPFPLTDYEFAVAARIDGRRDRTAAIFSEHALPLNSRAWGGIDLLIVSDERVLKDGSNIELLRRYLATGGRVWIMVDLVPCELVRPLLSPGQICEEVGRVMFNEFMIDPIGPLGQLAEQDRRVESSRGIPFVRVLHEGGIVRIATDNWPITIEMNVGYGQLILTTLDSRGWIEPRIAKTNVDPKSTSTYQTRAWAKYFLFDVNETRPKLPLSEQVDYPLKQIGNPIVPRGWVAVALLGSFAFLVILGAGLHYARRLTLFGAIAPMASVLVGFGLIGGANWIRRDISESLSRFQIVEACDDGNFVSIREQSAVFLSSSADMQLEGSLDGVAQSSESITTGVQRFQVDDFHSWQLANDDWPPGLWRYRADFTLPTNRLVVRGLLSSTGLFLQTPEGLPSPLQDPVLSFNSGSPMLCEASGEGFQVNNAVTVAGDRWIAGSFLSDEQQRRLELYRKFFEEDEKLQRPSRRIYGWTGVWDGSRWNRQLTPLGSALVGLPVMIERPDAGTDVLIPHGLIRLQKKPDSAVPTSAFDDRSGKWAKNVSTGTDAELQFVLPQEVVPMKVTSIELELDIRAPQREVIISVQTPAGIVELAKLDSPSIPWTSTITDSAILETANDGILDLLVRVGDSSGGSSSGFSSNMIQWQIDHLHASVRGIVQPKSTLATAIP